MKKMTLNISQRIIASSFYVLIFIIACRFFSESWTFLFDSNNAYNIIFISGALLLVLGSYIAEPFFTKPTDVLTNSIAVILALLSIGDKNNFIGYWYLFTASTLLVIGATILFFLYYFPKTRKIQSIATEILTKFGQSKVIFSVIYIATLFSFFQNKPIDFAFFITFWAIFITSFIVENSIIWITKIFSFVKKTKTDLLGEAIGCENPFLYKVEVDYFKHHAKDVKKGELVYLSLDNNEGAVGLIINEKQLLNKKWITVYLLEKNNDPLKINFRNQEFISGSKTIFSKDNAVYSFDLDSIEDQDSKETVKQNYLYKNRENFIGYITEGSNINKIKFNSLLDSTNHKYKLLKEGSVIKTGIYNNDVLYQIIDGRTNEEELEKHNIYGFLTGIAQKLGKYNKDKEELEVVKWLPDIYSPVFFDETKPLETNPLSIGKLPETELEIIIKDIDSLVTHNTAILGILGIGKSCLTFELIKKIIDNSDVKIICIDITNEYKRELLKYLNKDLIQEELSNDCLTELKDNNKRGSADNPTSWGNETLYKTKLNEEFAKFKENNDKQILLLNPDWHSVSKAGSQFKISHKVDLTVAEKTRIISERVFVHAKKEWELLTGEEKKTNEAKYLLVFEEAHSLIPEWNSASNSGDQNASNGTAKVILQGRKYGLGSLVVTQRTANISKSILNQCNTIFALRVFDDTGKQFLENYIGSDYSNTLPTLQERHAIVVGKALKLKQPVIVKLNDQADIIK